jgi:hypothetical protein
MIQDRLGLVSVLLGFVALSPTGCSATNRNASESATSVADRLFSYQAKGQRTTNENRALQIDPARSSCRSPGLSAR